MNTSTKYQTKGRSADISVKISKTEHNFRKQTDAHWNARELNEADEEN